MSYENGLGAEPSDPEEKMRGLEEAIKATKEKIATSEGELKKTYEFHLGKLMDEWYKTNNETVKKAA